MKKKEEIYKSLYFKEKLKTFLFYTSENITNEYINEFVDNYIKIVFPKFKKMKYDDFIKKSIYTIDTYGTGIGLKHVFMASLHLFEEEHHSRANSKHNTGGGGSKGSIGSKNIYIKSIKQNFYDLFSNMVSPDFTIRYTIEEIIEKYDDILSKWELLRNYDDTKVLSSLLIKNSS